MSSIEEILEKVVNQEISIREASRITGISRDFIRVKIIEKYKDNPCMLHRIYLTFGDNKRNSTTIMVDESELEKYFWLLMNKKMTLQEIGQEIGIDNKETIKNKMLEFVITSNNPQIKQLFAKYIEKNHRDYSHINFRLIAIDMVVGDYSQSEIAKILGLSPRTLSREFDKFKNDEDLRFYQFIKEYSGQKMRRQKFTPADRLSQINFINQYCLQNEELLVDEFTSRTEEKIKKEKEVLEQEAILRLKGLTQKQIAEELGVSVSYIRRAKINEEQRQLFEQKMFNDGISL